MDELLQLREYVIQHRYTEALDLIAEMEEMSREDKINKMYSYALVLLLHLIKQEAEQRSTRSWDLSIREAVRQIVRVNKRQKAGSSYLDQAGLAHVVTDAYQSAVERAALEAFEGRYEDNELAAKVNQAKIERKALQLILAA
jgi:Domain of unknown function DUF29